MNGFERRKQKKMEQIFNVSVQLFFKYGFQKVSVNEIARMANVSPATIYNYFGTKERLYADMLVNWMDKQLEQYESILDSELSFLEKTRKIMLLEAKNLKILSGEFPKLPESDVEGLAQMLESYTEEKVKGFFIKFVAAGKQAGHIHPDLTEEVTMLYFTMFKNELGKYWGAAGEDGQALNIDQLIELFFYGLAGRDA
ncbi:HTH-type transcriptional repressor KstR2 [Chlamydia abortus]|uniref:TetR/AcrR family transcriptional regulator n=1 Tax=Paenibacillus residui TaxID=629724 RepID=A0ABW3D3G8_9BACL|nr:HTH-type transcriptional repressor KstR2 [Chlamydia abortus]